jgi:hypothetical protein
MLVDILFALRDEIQINETSENMISNNYKKKIAMKSYSIIIILIFSSIFVSAQTVEPKFKEKEESNAEKFSSKSGTLMQRVHENIGTIKRCEIEVVYYTDLISGEKSNALKFEFDYSTSYTTYTKKALLDVDEIDGLIKSIKHIQEKIFSTTPTNYTEVFYRSRSGFAAGCYINKGEWKTFLKLERFDDNSYIWLSKDDFPKLLAIIEIAKTKI